METYRWFSEFAQTAGLAYFTLIFLLVLIFTFWPGRKNEMDAAARLPLNED